MNAWEEYDQMRAKLFAEPKDSTPTSQPNHPNQPYKDNRFYVKIGVGIYKTTSKNGLVNYLSLGFSKGKPLKLYYGPDINQALKDRKAYEKTRKP